MNYSIKQSETIRISIAKAGNKMNRKYAMAVLSALIFAANVMPANAAVIKNGAKCVKEGQIAKVGSKSYTCKNFGGSLMWSNKGWAPVITNPYAYDNAYELLLSYSDNRLWNLDYELVFNGSYANRSRAMNWCDDYFVTPSQFGRYYSYSGKDLNQAILGCTDAVMRRDG
jgi:hypothetical protein